VRGERIGWEEPAIEADVEQPASLLNASLLAIAVAFARGRSNPFVAELRKSAEKALGDLAHKLALVVSDPVLPKLENRAGEPAGHLLHDGALRREHLLLHPFLERRERELARTLEELLGIAQRTHDPWAVRGERRLLLVGERV